MIDIPGDLVCDLTCAQQASYLEGGPLVWMLPLYLHINQKSNYDDDMIWLLASLRKICCKMAEEVVGTICTYVQWHVTLKWSDPDRNQTQLRFYCPTYEGESISNQPFPFSMDRDGHDFHALFQCMFYTWVQNCTRMESFFNKILNVKRG